MPARRMMLTIVVAGLFFAGTSFAFDPEQYEEAAGQSVTLQLGGDVMGLSFDDGTWLRNTPVFGQYSVSFFSSDVEDAYYGGIGMIFRLMPHWDVAPFAGAGLSYNYPFIEHGSSDRDARSFWGRHVEGGVRVWFRERTSFLELSGRQTWTGLSGDSDFWSVGIAYGQNSWGLSEVEW